MRHGRFITIEGIEGAGKSTQMITLRDHLVEHGIDVVATREPGGTRLGERVRDVLLDKRSSPMQPDTELLLLFAARAEHLHHVVLPALAAGTWVVCDRFTDATYAYQGGGRGVSAARIAVLERWVQGDLRPHLTLLLDADVDRALSRIGARQAEDRFEAESPDFFRRVRRAYLDRANREPERFRVIDANQPAEQVGRRIVAVCDELLGSA